MDAFIDSMDLMTAMKYEDEEEPEEALQPKHVFNPARQRQLQCIEHRALNPGQPLRPLDKNLAKYAMGNRDEMLETAADKIEDLVRLFPLSPMVTQRL